MEPICKNVLFGYKISLKIESILNLSLLDTQPKWVENDLYTVCFVFTISSTEPALTSVVMHDIGNVSNYRRQERFYIIKVFLFKVGNPTGPCSTTVSRHIASRSLFCILIYS